MKKLLIFSYCIFSVHYVISMHPEQRAEQIPLNHEEEFATLTINLTVNNNQRVTQNNTTVTATDQLTTISKTQESQPKQQGGSNILQILLILALLSSGPQ